MMTDGAQNKKFIVIFYNVFYIFPRCVLKDFLLLLILCVHLSTGMTRPLDFFYFFLSVINLMFLSVFY